MPGPDYKYARFLPSYDKEYKLPPLEPFEHKDPGHAALKHPDPRHFLKDAKVNNLTPKFGTEVEGIQLSQLDDAGKRWVKCRSRLTIPASSHSLSLSAVWWSSANKTSSIRIPSGSSKSSEREFSMGARAQS